MSKRVLFTIIVTLILASTLAAQFPIKIPKITLPKIEEPKTSEPVGKENDRSDTLPNHQGQSGLRQMVMDDGFTFFDADPVKARNPKNTGDVDIGWYLRPKLRLIGTFPDNSGFRVVVKQNGKELSKFFCSAMVYRQGEDRRFTPGKYEFGWGFDDFMYDRKCSNEDKAIKELGLMDVEIFYVDGATDKETLVRKHKIDVHKALQIEGYKGSTYPGVSDYFIQRYAEAAVGIIHAGGGNYLSYEPFSQPSHQPIKNGLRIMIPHVPDKKTYFLTYLRCTVNGNRISLTRDKAQLNVGGGGGQGEFFESALMKRKDPEYSERITFTYLNADLPLTLTPGKWECAFMENGEAHRTIRFEVGSDNKIVPHPEQKSGNINLYHKAFLVDVEIPAGGSAIDGRSLPMPDAGIFYGIPWSTPEGKAAAAKVPKKGNPYPVMPK